MMQMRIARVMMQMARMQTEQLMREMTRLTRRSGSEA